MKKLVTLASVVAIACGLQAANYQWGFTSADIQDSTGTYIDGGTAFLYMGTVLADEHAFDTSGATLMASAGQNATYDYGDLSGSASSDLVTATSGQAYTLILLEESNVASLDGYTGNYILVNGTSEKAQMPDPTNPSSLVDIAAFTSGTDFGASDWQEMTAAPTPPEPPTPGVPEPTSGLLLVMGLAGLALKRKRA